MAQLVIERSPLLTKVRAVIRADGLRCEIGRPPAPPAGEVAPKVPYVILYPVPGSFDSPTLDAPEGSGIFLIQATSVGELAAQAEMVSDRVRRILLGRANGAYVTNLDDTESGQKVTGRGSEGAGPIDMESKLAMLPERFWFFVSL